jgi:hypothetical protein
MTLSDYFEKSKRSRCPFHVGKQSESQCGDLRQASFLWMRKRWPSLPLIVSPMPT